MSELKAGVDRPGGRSGPNKSVGDHDPRDPEIGRVFGKPLPKRRGYSPIRENVQDTVMPAGLIEPEPQAEEKTLQPGDVLSLDSKIMGFEEYQPGKWRPAGGIAAGDYTLERTIELGQDRKPLFKFRRSRENRPDVIIYLKPIGHGHGWERIEKE